ncbi:DUF1989 domain-containing protein [Lacticaseibacillus sp. GG6-2]
MELITTTSDLKVDDARLNQTILSGDGYFGLVKAGETLRITDIGGNQSADTTFFMADDPADHFSAVQTLTAQAKFYLTTGTILKSEAGRNMVTITADTVGSHDTLGGSCSAQSNTVRYALAKRYMHNCRDTFMKKIGEYPGDYIFSKRDLAPNINFFMNVPITPSGDLDFSDGISHPGAYIEMRAEHDVLFLMSNCPQLNNPCNGWNPTPVAVTIWD